MKLDILFIRHAFSCANALGKKSKSLQWRYADPELTAVGIDISKNVSSKLLDTISELWGDNLYTIGASQMIRTQETAYYMLAKPLNAVNSINIFPHISEAGSGYDNWAFPREKQLKIMGSRNPDILNYFGVDKSKKQSLSDKSSINMFINWAEHNPSIFAKGNDGYYRAVVFTHSIFLRKWFGPSKIKNNNGIRMRYNTEGFEVEKEPSFMNPYNRTRMEFLESWVPIDLVGDLEISNKCPDGCIKSSCSLPSSALKINVTNTNQPFYSMFGNTKKRGRVPRNIVGGLRSSLKAPKRYHQGSSLKAPKRYHQGSSLKAHTKRIR